MLDLFPEGFEEAIVDDMVELAAYTDAHGEQRLSHAFSDVASIPVAEDWRDRWRSFHRPVRIGPLWVGPPWEQPPAAALAVVIDPGRAFGTGAHATTRLCLELLLELEPASLLDLGCGSGVLAIAAARLGFSPIHAVDIDAVAVAVTLGNARRNAVDVQARLVEADGSDLPVTDIAVANIAFETVEALVPALSAAAVVTSGYLAEQHPSFAQLRHAGRRTVDGWAADLYLRQ
jgi:ribosomal protein L11 methyltransferase